jgi:hypothetical protein
VGRLLAGLRYWAWVRDYVADATLSRPQRTTRTLFATLVGMLLLVAALAVVGLAIPGVF